MTISVIMDYTIKARQINSVTVIYLVDVEMLDGGDIKNYWSLRLLLPSARHAVRRFTIFWKNSSEESSLILF